MKAANRRSQEERWCLKVVVTDQGDPIVVRSKFLVFGTGYYGFHMLLQTIIPGIEKFRGKVIHPQFWPEDYNYTGKDVVIIGSGATSVTILPSIADKARRATLLQRSAGYIFSLSHSGLLTRLLFMVLPATTARYLSRLIWLFRSFLTTAFCRSCPGLAKRIIKRFTI